MAALSRPPTVPHAANIDAWDELAGLRPRLRPELVDARHVYRGRVWHVLHDPLSGRSHRMPLMVHRLVALLDGRRSLGDAWQALSEQLGEDAPTRSEAAEVLVQLTAAGLLASGARATAAPRLAATGWRRALANPLAVRIGLFDPDRLLDALAPFARHLFTRAGGIAWLILVAAGLAVAVSHWTGLTAHWSTVTPAPGTLALVAIAYVAMKILHELAHGLATKIWGGEVHEIGIQLLVLIPLPYVDASSSTGFAQKHRRIGVCAAGIAAELALAAAAVIVWSQCEPGALRDIALNVALVGGVSTLLFNGNPLLRFDGYHVLVEVIEIPNLGQRSIRYLRHLLERHLFGVQGSRSPVSAPGELPWLAAYGIVAGAYRWVIAVAIVWFVASVYPVVGLVLAAWASASLLGTPIVRAARYLAKGPSLAGRRVRATTCTLALCGTVWAVLFALPAPYASRAEGVVWPPDDAHVRTETRGFLAEVLVQPGQIVVRGEPLLRLHESDLATEIRVLEARRAELEAELAIEAFGDRVRAASVRDAIAALNAEVAVARKREARMLVSSPTDGVFVPLGPRDPVGRYLRQGERIGLVVEQGRTVVRTVVSQDVAGLISARPGQVAVRFADGVAEVVEATIRSEVPAARRTLPSGVLGTTGGGVVAVDPTDERGLRTLALVFELVLEVSAPPQLATLGQRVHLRFDHGSAPLADQWWRQIRHAFLGKFGV
jgi:putative peptide zinc metalloprotease protein